MWRISRLASPRKQDDGSSKYGENYAKESQVRVVVDIPKTSGYGPKSAIIKYHGEINVCQKEQGEGDKDSKHSRAPS